MKRVLFLAVLAIVAGVIHPGNAQAKALNVCQLVSASQAAQILGFAVDTRHGGAGTTHCLYVGKAGDADVRVIPVQGRNGDPSVMMMMGGRKPPPGHSFVYARKSHYLVTVITAPKMDGAAKKLLDTVTGKL